MPHPFHGVDEPLGDFAIGPLQALAASQRRVELAGQTTAIGGHALDLGLGIDEHGFARQARFDSGTERLARRVQALFGSLELFVTLHPDKTPLGP